MMMQTRYVACAFVLAALAGCDEAAGPSTSVLAARDAAISASDAAVVLDASKSVDATDAADAAADAPDAAALDAAVPTPTCGASGQTCCGARCNDGLDCHAGVCGPIVTNCGGDGQACCVGPVGRLLCDNGFACLNDTCRPCGAPGLACCDYNTAAPCQSGALCNNASQCVAMATTDACGHPGEPCCDGQCTGAHLCVAGTCVPRVCGDRGLPCCEGVRRCNGGVCRDGLCQRPPRSCGRHDQPCCDGGECAPLYACTDGRCVPRDPTCGVLGAPCCTNVPEGCGSRLLCMDGVCAPFPTCGATGQRCCAAGEGPSACEPRARCVDARCVR